MGFSFVALRLYFQGEKTRPPVIVMTDGKHEIIREHRNRRK